MISHNLNQVRGQFPALGQQSAAVAMGETQNLLFRLMQGNTFLPGNLVCSPELLRQGP